MENKTTIQLIELLDKVPEEGDKRYDEFWSSDGIYERAMGELRTRYPFADFLDPDTEESIPSAWEAIKELQEEVKLLKRHKHEEKSGDVMIRI